jgi:MSHA biogenesis protein MshP
MKKMQNKPRGFSLISAIFLLVVISALATFSVTLFTTQQRSAALDVLGERAYQAARAGIEWGAYQILQNNGGAFALACRPGPTPPQAVALTGTLAGFTVMVNCVSASSIENATTLWVYQLTSTATQGTQGTPNYLERQMQVTIAN